MVPFANLDKSFLSLSRSVLYASAEYIHGILQYNESKEPNIPDFGLARGHLINGYPQRWKLYQTVRAESVSICKEIKATIESYEKIILDEIDKEIQTPSGKSRLERKNAKEVFTEDGSYPTKFDFNSLYLYDRILAQIFNEVNNKSINKKETQDIRITQFAGIKDLKIGYRNSQYTTIGLGDGEMMEELKKRVERLVRGSSNTQTCQRLS